MSKRVKHSDSDKPWNRKKTLSIRAVSTKDTKEKFLIICEGEKTEVNYFSAFRVPKEIILIEGLGANTDSLVEKAIEIDKEQQLLGNIFDQKWCVFDRDSFQPQNFNRALQLAKNNGFNLAYSNESFEIWYLLHFHLYNTGISRADYKDKLSRHLRKEYLKNDSKIYYDLENNQINAINHANKLLSDYKKNHEIDPLNNNPSTTVHFLVLQLNKYLN